MTHSLTGGFLNIMRNEDIGTNNGTAVITPDEPVTACSGGQWQIRYTAGAQGVAVGGSVRFEIPYGFTPPQLSWTFDAGHVAASTTNPGVRLKLSLEPPVTREDEPFYYVTRWGRMIYVQVLDAPLGEGDAITLTYGRHLGLKEGVTVRHFAGRAEFTVATDTDGTRSAKFSGYTLIADQPALTVVGDSQTSFRIIAPSIIESSESFTVRLVPTDTHLNLAQLTPAPLRLHTSDATCDIELVESANESLTGVGVFDLPGVKLIGAQAKSGISGVSNPVVVTHQALDNRLFWGDIHGHTGLSDGLGTPQEYFEFGRNEALLDFCAIADHAQYLSDEDWEEIQQVTRRWNTPGEFVTILGYEYSCNASLPRYGDKCLYYPGDTGPLLRETDINRTAYHDMAEYAPVWKDHGAMMILHQHARGSCSFYDPDLVRLAEVYSVWGASEEENSTRPLLPAMTADYRGHYAADALALGWVLGFVGSSDDHAGRPGCSDWLRVRQAYPGGLVAVWAPELTREAVWEALWNRRCYATTGARIVVDFRVDGEPMGSIIHGSAFSEGHRLEARIVGDAPLAAVSILRGREVIYSCNTASTEVCIDFHDEPPGGASNYYYVRATQSDGEMAWSSPVWIS